MDITTAFSLADIVPLMGIGPAIMMGIGALANAYGAYQAGKSKSTHTDQTTTRTPGLGSEPMLEYILQQAMRNQMYNQPDIGSIIESGRGRYDALFNLPTGRTGVGDGYTPSTATHLPAYQPPQQGGVPNGMNMELAAMMGLGGGGGQQFDITGLLQGMPNIEGPNLEMANSAGSAFNQQIQPHGQAPTPAGFTPAEFGELLKNLFNPVSLFNFGGKE